MKPADLPDDRAALRERFQQAQRAHMEVIISRARLLKDIAQSRELMAHTDFVLTWPYVMPPDVSRENPSGPVSMKADECRRKAQLLLILAEQPGNSERRRAMIKMAGYWIDEADRIIQQQQQMREADSD